MITALLIILDFHDCLIAVDRILHHTEVLIFYFLTLAHIKQSKIRKDLSQILQFRGVFISIWYSHL